MATALRPETTADIVLVRLAQDDADSLRAAGVVEPVAARAAVVLARRGDAERILDRLLEFARHGHGLRFDVRRAELANELLAPWLEGPPPGEGLQQRVQRFLLDQLGDPRLRPARWKGVEPRAMALFRSWLDHATVAGLSAGEAARLQLPPAVDAVAVVETEGLVARPDFRVRLDWERPGGQALPGARRLGAWLDVGTGWRRIPEPLFSLAEAVDVFAEVVPGNEAGRMRALARLCDLLPDLRARGAARTPNLLDRLRIAVADAFSLDLQGEGANARLVPVLHRAGAPADGAEPAPLLDPARQNRFGRELFDAYSSARGVYVLGSGDWVVLTPLLRRALQVVREVQAAPWPVKKELLRAPRAFIADRLGGEDGSAALESLVVETRTYGERVRGLGLWQPRVLPWIEIASTDWLGAEDGPAGPPGTSPGPVRGGILLGDRRIPLSLEQAAELRKAVEGAIGRDEDQIAFEHPELGSIELPASSETLAAVQKAIDALSRAARPESAREQAEHEPTGPGPEVLLIEPNETELGFEARFRRRPSGPVERFARAVRTPLKEHQRAGVVWLQRSWEAGRPGALLADEMGLGKTLQVLAFLAWMREAMENGPVERAPFLIVAPTGLLANWKTEHDRHLDAPGLGRLVEAFGKGLQALKRRAGDDRLALDLDKLAQADWILTTYETLRDWQKDFGRVHFAVLVFDEAQKIKNPGIRLTDAAKAMKAEFKIALTGTPVENRLADLWCIADTVQPGILGDLKTFSATYEQRPDPERLRRLRRLLDRADRITPPFLLRRLRADHLPDLPPFTVDRRERPMPSRQLDAYRAAIDRARCEAAPGAMLQTLHRLRSVSLHPEPDLVDEESFIEGSARLDLAIEALDAIVAAGEAALVFLDDLDFASRLQGVLQRRYQLPQPPRLISGEIAGGQRQRIVEAFQRGRGFGILLMIPRAGGVGLTLTRANHVIHLDRWWNPAVEDQCNGRVLRIGQEREVRILLPLAVLPDGRPSFDLNLDALLERKRRLHEETLAPPALEESELADLFERTVG